MKIPGWILFERNRLLTPQNCGCDPINKDLKVPCFEALLLAERFILLINISHFSLVYEKNYFCACISIILPLLFEKLHNSRTKNKGNIFVSSYTNLISYHSWKYSRQLKMLPNDVKWVRASTIQTIRNFNPVNSIDSHILVFLWSWYLEVLRTKLEELFFSRVHATLNVTMSVRRSVGRSVRNHFSFLGV